MQKKMVAIGRRMDGEPMEIRTQHMVYMSDPRDYEFWHTCPLCGGPAEPAENGGDLCDGCLADQRGES